MKEKILYIIPFAILLLLIPALPKACTHPDTALRVLESSGYTEVEITGWRPFSKGEDDWFSTGFRAKSPSGANTTGVVTGGLFLKGNTIRVD